ncbi:hypothetical protein N9L68_01975 [bacterium]|nr:hypothetical protein [bacterium]
MRSQRRPGLPGKANTLRRGVTIARAEPRLQNTGLVGNGQEGTTDNRYNLFLFVVVPTAGTTIATDDDHSLQRPDVARIYELTIVLLSASHYNAIYGNRMTDAKTFENIKAFCLPAASPV